MSWNLLQAGHHDEMVVLFRRQLEDSMRLHYLAANRDRADELILGHQRMRELMAQRQLDRAINPFECSQVDDPRVEEEGRSAASPHQTH